MPLAASEVAGDAVYEFARLESLGDSPWQMFALMAGVALVLVYVWWMYRREARTVSTAKATVLALLRTVAIAGLVAFFLGLEKRGSTQVIEPSRVAVLVDTSLSMNLPDHDSASDDKTTRAESMQQLLTDSPLLEQLIEQHEVDLVAMGDQTRQVAYLAHQLPDEEQQADDSGQPRPLLDPAAITSATDPVGRETRIGDAIAATLDQYQGLPLAGIVLLSEGGQNRGLELPAAGEAAAAAAVKVYSIGFGPTTAPANIVVRDLIAPERAYPGDTLTLQAVIQAQDLAGQQVELQLSRRPATEGDEPSAADWELMQTEVLPITSDDALETVRIETKPGEPGSYVYEVRALPAPREVLNSDNSYQAEVAVVDRETRVLLFAGGPTRDYRFLRNQLRRDASFVVDVLLQSGVPGISQDANEILTEFPTTAEALSKYDAIVAFDPDWSPLSVEQVRWLEQWVARQAGGLVVVPGRVNTPRWGIDARMRTIRGLYPVRMPDQLIDLRRSQEDRDTPRHLQFTREGQEAEFLRLADSGSESGLAWEAFAGVFSALEHNGPKPGAAVYANLAGESDDEPGPAYLVGQYYGAGQVLYAGSGEFWRLRKLDPAYNDRLWTGILRHTSQGRLLQGSPRGKLLISQDRYELGATVPVRAMLSDLQMEPLVADGATLEIAMPGGRQERLELAADNERAGNFAGEFRVVLPGTYRLSLAIPDSTDELTRTLKVTVPQLEVGQTTRDSDALAGIAAQTGGIYYANARLALDGSDTTPSLTAALPSQSRTKRVVGAIDKPFARSQSFWLLAVVAGALSLEWIIRRLSYLA